MITVEGSLCKTKMAEDCVADDIEIQEVSNAVSFSMGDSFESFDALQTKIN